MVAHVNRMGHELVQCFEVRRGSVGKQRGVGLLGDADFKPEDAGTVEIAFLLVRAGAAEHRRPSVQLSYYRACTGCFAPGGTYTPATAFAF
jgi:hypothetical protein